MVQCNIFFICSPQVVRLLYAWSNLFATFVVYMHILNCESYMFTGLSCRNIFFKLWFTMKEFVNY